MELYKDQPIIQLIDVSEDFNKTDKRILDNIAIEYSALLKNEHVIVNRKLVNLNRIKKFFMAISNKYLNYQMIKNCTPEVQIGEWFKSKGYKVIYAEEKDLLVTFKIKKI
ncbi:MAG: hypothetical protein RPU73_06010 [Candidatus Sedimenticola sp. (ex Thyasira tokunagai)]